MTLRDEVQLQRHLLFGGRRGRILLSAHMYRKVRHHPHFRFFIHRFERRNTDASLRQPLTGINGWWIDEASLVPDSFAQESVGQTPNESV